jgi:hypothetical protein
MALGQSHRFSHSDGNVVASRAGRIARSAIFSSAFSYNVTRNEKPTGVLRTSFATSNGFGADLSKRVECGKPNSLIMPSFAS